MAADRRLRVLHARRDQAVGSLREVERRQAAGEIDDAEAAELIELFAGRAAVATAELEEAGGRAARRGPERYLPVAAVAVVLVLTAVVVAVSQLSGDDGGDPPAALEQPAQQRDLSEVSNEEMEEVVAANPGVVPMRLALVERYLADGELDKARAHAREAAERAAAAGDRHRAKVYLGWTTALLGEQTQGAALLEEAVAEEPADLNARWFLANVLADAGDRERAAELLRTLLDGDIGDQQRAVVERKLATL